MDSQGRPFSRFGRAFSDSSATGFADDHDAAPRYGLATARNKRRVDSDSDNENDESGGTRNETSLSQQEKSQRSLSENSGGRLLTPSRRLSQTRNSFSQPVTRSSTPVSGVRRTSSVFSFGDDVVRGGGSGGGGGGSGGGGGGGSQGPAWRTIGDDDENTQMGSGSVLSETPSNDWIVVPVKYYGRPEQRLMQMRKPASGRHGLRPVPFPLPNGLIFEFETPPEREQRQGAGADQNADPVIKSCRMIDESGAACFRGLGGCLKDLQEGISPMCHKYRSNTVFFHYRSQIVSAVDLKRFAKLDYEFSSTWRGAREGPEALLPFLRPPTCWSEQYQERDSVAHGIVPTTPHHCAAADVNRALYRGDLVFELENRIASLALETSGMWSALGRGVVSTYVVKRLRLIQDLFSGIEEESSYVADLSEVDSWQGLTLVVSQIAPDIPDVLHVPNSQFLSVAEIAQLIDECDRGKHVVLSGQPMRSTPLFFSLWSELVYATWNGVLKLRVITCSAPRFVQAREWDGDTTDHENTVYFSEDDELCMDVNIVGGDVSVRECDAVHHDVLCEQEFGERPILDKAELRCGPWGIMPDLNNTGDPPTNTAWHLYIQKRVARLDLEPMRHFKWQSPTSPYIPSHIQSVWIDRRADYELRSLEYVAHVPVVVVHTSHLSPPSIAVFAREVSMFERVQDAVIREEESDDELMNEEDLDFIEQALPGEARSPSPPASDEDMFE